jgi:hypothetical protein
MMTGGLMQVWPADASLRVLECAPSSVVVVTQFVTHFTVSAPEDAVGSDHLLRPLLRVRLTISAGLRRCRLGNVRVDYSPRC